LLWKKAEKMANAIPSWFSELTWAGKVRTVPFRPLNDKEIAVFDRDFDMFVTHLNKHDPEIAQNFNAKREWYKVCAGIFAETFDLPFGGVETSSGEFGFTFPIPARPFFGEATGVNTWVKTVAAGANNLFGASGSEIAGNSTVTTRRMYAYQGLLSVMGDPKLLAFALNVNGYQYPYQNTLAQIKVPKKDTWIREIPFAKGVLIHPTGKHYLVALFEQAGQVELIPLGTMFAEHDYLLTQSRWYA